MRHPDEYIAMAEWAERAAHEPGTEARAAQALLRIGRSWRDLAALWQTYADGRTSSSRWRGETAEAGPPGAANADEALQETA